MAHQCRALLLHCIDFRFIHDLLHYMKAQGLDRQYDDVGAAGAVKNLVDPNEVSDREFILRQIDIAQNLHGISEVYLVNHLDCGAYGKIFSSAAEELTRHQTDLEKAARLIKERFPRLAVTTLLASIVDGRVVVRPSGRA